MQSPFTNIEGFAENQLIYNVFNNIFFAKFERGLGIVYAEHFHPLPLATIALIITAVSNASYHQAHLP